MPNLQVGKTPLSIAPYRSLRWKSGSWPAILRASSQTREWTPRVGGEGEGVNAEALHHSEGSRDSAVAHCPHEHVGCFSV